MELSLQLCHTKLSPGRIPAGIGIGQMVPDGTG